MNPTQRSPHLALACALSLGAAVSLGITRFAYGLLLPPMRPTCTGRTRSPVG